MSILTAIKKAKEKIINESLNNNILRRDKVKLINLPLFSLSAFACGISIMFNSISISMGFSSGLLMAINAVILSFTAFNYMAYKRGSNKTINDIKNNDYDEIIRNINFYSFTTGSVDVSPERNNEFVNVLTAIYKSDFDKKITDKIYSSIRKEINLEDLQYILNDPELLEIQRKNNISSGLYVYSLLLKIENFAFENKEISLEERNKRMLSGLTVEEQYQQMYICGDSLNDNSERSLNNIEKKLKRSIKESYKEKEKEWI
jgi:hypothetical protein